MNLWAIFLTGLTTGGITCLAIQGGLLATAMTKQVEVPLKGRKRKGQTVTAIQVTRDMGPVLYFLAAKLLAYIVLGLLLGALGEVVQITPGVQAAMQIFAGLFLLATALNMLNVHPIFRYVAIQPPRFLTRMVRNQATSESLFAPLLLGAMTVLIPCGTTQAMMVLAISSGSALLGALIMGVFILGTAPTFAVLGFAATKLGTGSLRKTFATAAALLIVVLGFWSLDAGLKLSGAPFAPSRLLAGLFAQPEVQIAEATVVGDRQELTITVDDRGCHPNIAYVRGDLPVRLWMETNGTFSCARAFSVPSLNIMQVLPDSGRTAVDLPALGSGSLRYMCSMGMFEGVLVVKQQEVSLND